MVAPNQTSLPRCALGWFRNDHLSLIANGTTESLRLVESGETYLPGPASIGTESDTRHPNATRCIGASKA